VSSSQKVGLIVIGGVAFVGGLVSAVYIMLSKMQIINKVINPRKIRNFTKI